MYGIASGSIIRNGGIESVYAGGVAAGAVVGSDGVQIVSGGAAYNTIIENGGSEIVSGYYLSAGGGYAGSSSDTVVNRGGLESVVDGGSAFFTTVSSGGGEIVSSGSVAYDTTLAGGALTLLSGGAASDAVTFAGAGGKLVVSGTVMPSAVISGFALGDAIQLAAIGYDPANTVSINTANVVTVSAGGATYKLNIAGAMVGATNFSLSSATSGGGTILTDPPASDFASIGADITSSSMDFLTVNGGVSGATPPLAALFSLHDISPADHATIWPASHQPIWGATGASIIGGSQITHLAAMLTNSSLSLASMSGTA